MIGRICLSVFNIPMVLDNFAVNMSKWLVQFRCLFIIMPRKLKLSTNAMSSPAILSEGSCIRFWGMWKTIALVLFIFSESLFAFNQLWKFVNSWFNDSFLVSSLFRFVMSVVSSAKFINLNNSLEWAMSFIYMMNKRGPKMEPWGTPIKISVFWDNVSPYWTNCFLFDK